MDSEDSEDEYVGNLEQLNNRFIEILAELSNVISMEEKYRTAGIEMKNSEALLNMIERMNTIQKNLDERII
ncbi:hypothetical protein [Sulfuricurvum sp.]|uniref:hypothetical protein n=1 Tax=Sulfuricurvum sp. TaxID=2025608 RepID=UPI003C3F439A